VRGQRFRITLPDGTVEALPAADEPA